MICGNILQAKAFNIKYVLIITDTLIIYPQNTLLNFIEQFYVSNKYKEKNFKIFSFN